MKYYLVTGASSGIGRETAMRLSDSDTTVILVARREDRLKKLQQEMAGQSVIVPCDLRKSSDIANVFQVLSERNIKLNGILCRSWLHSADKSNGARKPGRDVSDKCICLLRNV